MGYMADYYLDIALNQCDMDEDTWCKPSRVDDIVFLNATLEHETDKARLFNIDSQQYWIPKKVHAWFPKKQKLFVQGWFKMIPAKPLKSQFSVSKKATVFDEISEEEWSYK